MSDTTQDLIMGAAAIVAVGAIVFLLSDRIRLRRSLQKLKADLALTESVARLGYWSRDTKSDRVIWSDGAYEVFGESRASFLPLARDIHARFFEEDLTRLFALSDPLNVAKSGAEAEFRIRCPDGTIKDVLLAVRYRFDRAGKHIGVFGIISDITARKSAQRASTERQELLDHALDAAGAATWDYDISTAHIKVSPRFAIMLGLDPSLRDLSRDEFRAFVHPDDRQRVASYFAQLSKKNPLYDVEYRLRHEAGHYVWLHVRAQIVRFVGDTPDRAIGTIIDISARREATDRLARTARDAHVLHAATLLAIESGSLENVIKRTIDLVCETTGWPVGHAFAVPRFDAEELRPMSIRRDVDNDRYAVLRDINRSMSFKPGDGLPGEVWLTRRPTWVDDIHADPRFAHLRVPALKGLRAAAAFPIVIGDEVRVVLEFFADAPMSPDVDLLRVFKTLGLQLGTIIKRLEADEELRESREALSLAIEGTQAGYFEVDIDTQTTTWSPRAREILGIGPDAPVPKPTTFHLIVHPDERQEFLAELEQFRARHTPIDVEARMLHASGHYVWAHLRVISVKDASGTPVRIIGLLRDVSAARVAQQALADSERKFRELIEQALLGIIVTRDGKPLFCNSAFAELLGYARPDEVLQLPNLIQHLPTAERATGEERWRQAFAAGEIESKVLRHEMIARDGSHHWLESIGRVIAWEGRPALQQVVIDVTAREKAQQELEASEERFRLLADNASDVVVLSDNGFMRYVSPSIERVAGYKPEELLGRHVTILSHPDDYPSNVELSGIQPAGQMRREWRMRRRDGSWIWIESTRSFVTSPDAPERNRVVAAWRNITERVEREAELAKARDSLEAQAKELALERERAERANLAKSQFLAMMSHELRTPMTGVLGMADLLLLSGLNAQQKELMGLLTRSARALLELLNDILDFSKIEAGQLDIETIPFRLSEIIGDVQKLFAPIATEKGLALEVRLPPTYLDVVLGDPRRLSQVLSNLISNAIKFTETGHIVVQLAQEQTSKGRVTLRFSIEDTGIGMLQEDAQRLFQPFVQADVSTSRKYGGTGLGLAICRRLVEGMGGWIDVATTPGKGSSFNFSIVVGHDPKARTKNVAASAEAKLHGLTADAPARSILVAEDNETSRYLISLMLGRLGHIVKVVNDGAQALDAVQQSVFDIVLMDMQMPVMDGVEATRAIRKLSSSVAKIPIIALTADVIGDHRGIYLGVGANAVVGKPVDWGLLSAEIARLTGSTIAQSPAKAARAKQSQVVSETKKIDAPILDEVALKGLSDALGETALNTMLVSFNRNMLKYRDDLKAVVAQGDLKQAKRIAHALKGLCAQFGAIRVSDFAKKIEVDVVSVEEVNPVMPDLIASISETEKALIAREQEKAP